MNELLANLERVVVYMDDVTVYRDNLEVHEKRLSKVLERKGKGWTETKQGEGRLQAVRDTNKNKRAQRRADIQPTLIPDRPWQRV